MANVINLTPHGVEVFDEQQFLGLEKINPTTWVADAVQGSAVASFPSKGAARISTSTKELESDLPGKVVKTEYGEATGFPEDVAKDDVFIVSLPMKSMATQSGHALAERMVSPYAVVRRKSNTSEVLGCMGFTY